MSRAIVILTFLALTTACAGQPEKLYDGPTRSKSDIAVLHRHHSHGTSLLIFGIPIPWPRYRTFVKLVDGNFVEESEIHISPGLHQVIVNASKLPATVLCGSLGCLGKAELREMRIEFSARVGHDYQVGSMFEGWSEWIWVEDKHSGEVVAGEKPPSENETSSNKTIRGQPPDEGYNPGPGVSGV